LQTIYDRYYQLLIETFARLTSNKYEKKSVAVYIYFKSCSNDNCYDITCLPRKGDLKLGWNQLHSVTKCFGGDDELHTTRNIICELNHDDRLVNILMYNNIEFTSEIYIAGPKDQSDPNQAPKLIRFPGYPLSEPKWSSLFNIVD
jgi:hypothetical protein